MWIEALGQRSGSVGQMPSLEERREERRGTERERGRERGRKRRQSEGARWPL